MTPWLVLDFETVSLCDLKLSGADRYAEDVSTEVLCLTGEDEKGRRKLWEPSMGNELPPLLALAIKNGRIFVAHNVRFERAIWQKIMVEQFGWPALQIEQWHDTMAVAAMLTLDQSLDKVMGQLHLPAPKDTEGSKLTISLSKINKKTGMLPERTPEILARVFSYNEHDIDSQVMLHRRIGWLPEGERKVWMLDQEINDRGVKLDMDFVRSAQLVVDRTTEPLTERFLELTGGIKLASPKLTGWVREHGVSVPNMQKETLVALLGEDVDSSEEDILDLVDEGGLFQEIPPNVREALHIRQLIGSASIKKLKRMEACACSDGRARGLLQYHGAGPGRWAGRLFQPQNFPRGSLKGTGKGGTLTDADRNGLIAAILTGDPDYVQIISGAPPVETVVSSLRYAITADTGHELVAGDFASIEARVCLALAGQWDKVSLLASGADVYCDMAQQIYGRPITKADMVERQTGKNSVLGLGFQMGAPKFYLRYCQDQSLEFAKRVVDAYRKDWAPEVPKLWYALQHAATQTVHTGLAHEAYGVLYEKNDLWLTARLPSDRRLWYFNPQPTFEAMPWDEHDIRSSFTYQAKKMNKRVTIHAFGGLLCENVVQGLARDLMVEAAFLAQANGFPIVLTVHDELLTEPERINADYKALEQIMNERSNWAKALNIPVATEGWSGDRYRK